MLGEDTALPFYSVTKQNPAAPGGATGPKERLLDHRSELDRGTDLYLAAERIADERFVIVILTRERRLRIEDVDHGTRQRDVPWQLGAAGADDFLSKPVQAEVCSWFAEAKR